MILDTSGYPFALVVAVLLLLALFWLLRTQRLREKYAVVWFVVVLGVVVLTFIPSVTGRLTALVGVETPINLIFIIAFLVLLGVCIQLSIEITGLEEQVRTVAEELALLRLEVERQDKGQAVQRGVGTDPQAAVPPVAPDPDVDPPPPRPPPPPRVRP